MADPIDVLLNKAQTYLRSAAVLFELEDFDSCASRSYFAMVYAVQALLVGANGHMPIDQDIPAVFRELFIDTGLLPPRAADALQTAQTAYELGDFSHSFAVAPAVAERTLQEAEAFVNTLTRMIEAKA